MMAGLTLSSSDEESESKPNESKLVNAGSNIPIHVPSVGKQPITLDGRVAPTTSSSENCAGLDFSKVAACDTLFAEDIGEDDEIFMVSTPLEIDPSITKNLSVDFDSSTSKVKCKINNAKTQFKVYRMPNPSSTVNLLLPSRKSNSFRSKTYPVNTRIILQKCPHMVKDEK